MNRNLQTMVPPRQESAERRTTSLSQIVDLTYKDISMVVGAKKCVPFDNVLSMAFPGPLAFFRECEVAA